MDIKELQNKVIELWGLFGFISVLAGILSWFFGGLYASVLGVAAAFLGFFGLRKRQKLCLIGMFLGCFAMLFVCLQDLGIVKRPSYLESDKSHLIKSIRATIDIHAIMKKNSPLDEKNKNRVIKRLKDALNQAKVVNIATIDNQVPGFAEQYKDHFIPGIELLIEGFEGPHIGKSLKGAVLLEKWAYWNKENRKKLGKIEEPHLSIVLLITGWI